MSTFLNAYSWINIRYLLAGLGVTLTVSLIAICLSFIIGLGLGLVRYRQIKVVSAAVGVVIDVIRNTPLLLIILFMYFWLPQIGLRVSPTVSTIISLVIFESTMLAEIVRGGIQAVPAGQMEGALANGLTYGQAMRHVVLPQALQKMIPPIVSQFIVIVKDTSLASAIIMPELLYRAQIVYGQNTDYLLPMYLAVAVMYFVVCFCLSLVARRLEKRFG